MAAQTLPETLEGQGSFLAALKNSSGEHPDAHPEPIPGLSWAEELPRDALHAVLAHSEPAAWLAVAATCRAGRDAAHAAAARAMHPAARAAVSHERPRPLRLYTAVHANFLRGGVGRVGAWVSRSGCGQLRAMHEQQAWRYINRQASPPTISGSSECAVHARL